jgi:hypothetical protein
MNTDYWEVFYIGEIEVRVEYIPPEFWVSVGTLRTGKVFLGKLTVPHRTLEGGTHRRRLFEVAMMAVMDLYEVSVRGNRGLRPDPLKEAFADAARALGPAMLADARSEVMRFRRGRKRGPKDWFPTER